MMVYEMGPRVPAYTKDCGRQMLALVVGTIRNKFYTYDDDTQTSLGIVGLVVLCDRCANAQDEEEGDIGCCAPQIDRSTAEPGGEEPGTRVGNETETSIDDVEAEGEIGRDTGLYMSS